MLVAAVAFLLNPLRGCNEFLAAAVPLSTLLTPTFPAWSCQSILIKSNYDNFSIQEKRLAHV